jgi:hypothetical protein
MGELAGSSPLDDLFDGPPKVIHKQITEQRPLTDFEQMTYRARSRSRGRDVHQEGQEQQQTERRDEKRDPNAERAAFDRRLAAGEWD